MLSLVQVKRESLGILGSSLGGLISCYAGKTCHNSIVIFALNGGNNGHYVC